MKKNMGSADRIIRIVLAIVVAILSSRILSFSTGAISGLAAIILGAFAIIFLLTSLMSFCPLYVPFKLSTAKKSES